MCFVLLFPNHSHWMSSLLTLLQRFYTLSPKGQLTAVFPGKFKIASHVGRLGVFQAVVNIMRYFRSYERYIPDPAVTLEYPMRRPNGVIVIYYPLAVSYF